MFNQINKVMMRTKESDNSHAVMTNEIAVDYLYFLGVKYPIREIDGLKISVNQLEDTLLDHWACSEAHELLEEMDGFLTDEELRTYSDERILELLDLHSARHQKAVPA